MNNGDMPAMPVKLPITQAQLQAYKIGGKNGSPEPEYAKGLTKREYFAAMAMQGMLSNKLSDIPEYYNDFFAKIAVNFADELLKALEANDE